MGFKISLSKELNDILKDPKATKSLVGKVRAEFKISGPKIIRKAILKDISLGISPVKGKGPFVKYSEMYKEMIRGKIAVFKKHGKTIVIRAKKGKKLVNQATKYNKGISPVNLILSGKLHKDLKAFTIGGLTTSFRLVLKWKNKLADIHNRQGAGKSKTIRRLLPTESGESFNNTITNVMLNEVKKAVKRVVKRL